MFWHSHAWKVTGAHPLDRVGMFPDGRSVRCPVTEVLMVCDCGKVRTVCLDGHWEFEQLLPKPAQPEADREFFRKLGVKL